MLKLRRQRPINRGTSPVIRPGTITVCAQVNHRLDGKAHARFGSSNSLILPVVRDIGRTVEKLVHAVTAVALDDGAILALGVFLDGVSGIAEEHAWFDELDCFVETFSGCFDDSYGLWIGRGF